MASDNASVIDLDGAFIMPGIHDVHLHPLEAVSDNFQFVVDFPFVGMNLEKTYGNINYKFLNCPQKFNEECRILRI